MLARLARQVEIALAECDLTLPQYRVLIHLSEGKEAPSVLADKLGVSRPSVTGVVDGLVCRGLVARDHDAEDRRRVGHTLTDAGKELLESADQEVERRLVQIAAHRPGGAADPLVALWSWREALDGHRAACHAARAAARERAEVSG